MRVSWVKPVFVLGPEYREQASVRNNNPPKLGILIHYCECLNNRQVTRLRKLQKEMQCGECHHASGEEFFQSIFRTHQAVLA